MDWEWSWTAARFFLDVLILLGFIVMGVYTWWTSRNHVTAAAIAKVDERVAKVDKRMTDSESRIRDVERQVKGLPTHHHLSEMHEKVNAVAGTMNQLLGEQRQMNHTLRLLHEHLLNSGGGSK
ncbi:MAG: DUF2730 family protein [Aquisalimonadaceae bacterium]